MSRNSTQINFIVHIPQDYDDKNKLQEIINNFYVQCIDSRLRESPLSLKQKEELIDIIIEKHKALQE